MRQIQFELFEISSLMVSAQKDWEMDSSNDSGKAGSGIAAPKHTPRPAEFGDLGRFIYGQTPPSGGLPCARTTPLDRNEINEVVEIIARGRNERHAAELPERLHTRDWSSVLEVILKLDERLSLPGIGWKIGAASEEVRRGEGLPSPSPGLIYEGTVFPSGAQLDRDFFINYRLIECEFAFQLGLDFPVRDAPYTESDARAGIDTLFPVLEIGDMVFRDWYGASSYFGSCLDNNSSAALIVGTKTSDWHGYDLAESGVDLYLNGHYIKSGKGIAAMGNPVTSLTWMLNWARLHGRAVASGEIVSTGTCTGHCFAEPGDTATGDFGPLGRVEVSFN